MEKPYLVTFDKDGNPLTWYKLEVGDYAEIAGKLEVVPKEYAYHDFVTREQLQEWFELDKDD